MQPRQLPLVLVQLCAVLQRVRYLFHDLQQGRLRLRRQKSLLCAKGLEDLQRFAQPLHPFLRSIELLGIERRIFIAKYFHGTERLQRLHNRLLIGLVCDQGQSLHLNNHAISCTFCIR